jgi:hypothetical protein
MAISHNRINYANQALYVGPSPSSGGHFIGLQGGSATPQKVAEDQGSGNLITQLYRIQSVNSNWAVNRVNVNQFGEQAAIDRVILDPPMVNLSFNYLLANMYNESGLGFHTQGALSAISGLLDKTQEDRNFFLRIAPQGQDAVGDTNSDINTFTYGFGNGFVNSYTTQAAVGGFPTVDVGVECMNMTFDTGISGWIPAIVPVNGARMTGFRYLLPTASGSPGTGYLDISVLRPGDITMNFTERSAEDEGELNAATSPYNTVGVSIADAHIQSYNLSFNLAREQMRRLGSKFAFSREVTFPVDVNLSVDAIVTQITTGQIADFLTCDKAYDVSINIKRTACPGDPTPVIARYILRNAKLNGQNYTSSIGADQRVTLNWASQVGSARQTGLGVFFSGITHHVTS